MPSRPVVAAAGLIGLSAVALVLYLLDRGPNGDRPVAEQVSRSGVKSTDGFGDGVSPLSPEAASRTRQPPSSAPRDARESVAGPGQPVASAPTKPRKAVERALVVPGRPAAVDDVDGAGSTEMADTRAAESSAQSQPPDPLAELPHFVDLPPLAARDRLNSVFDLGFVRLQGSEGVSFDLLGGQEALGERGSFEIEPGETPRSARVLMATHDDERGAGRIVSIARVAVENQRLTFLWLIQDNVIEAVCLRNCVLRLSVDDRSRNVAFRVPEPARALVVDVRRAGIMFRGRVADLPRRPSLRLEVIQPPPVFPNHIFDGQRFCAPDDRISIRIRGRSQNDLLLLQLAFFARRQGQLTVAVRTLTPDGARFDPVAAQNRLHALQTRRQVLQEQYDALPDAARGAVQTGYQQQVEMTEAQIAALLELNEACQRLLTTPLAFRIYLRHRDAEVDLIAANETHVRAS